MDAAAAGPQATTASPPVVAPAPADPPPVVPVDSGAIASGAAAVADPAALPETPVPAPTDTAAPATPAVIPDTPPPTAVPDPSLTAAVAAATPVVEPAEPAAAAIVVADAPTAAAAAPVDLDALYRAQTWYVPPKLLVTPVDLFVPAAEVDPKPGFAHAACQTTISSAPALRFDANTSVVIDDPDVAEVVQVMKRYQRLLRRVFDHYAAVVAGEGQRALAFDAFQSFVQEFSVLPTLIELAELTDVFKASCRTIAMRLGFRDFVECLTRLSLTVYRDSHRAVTSEQKLSLLFRAMQLDQKEIVLHRLRKPTTAAADGTTALGPPHLVFDLDQRDLDKEIDRIFQMFPDDKAPSSLSSSPSTSSPSSPSSRVVAAAAADTRRLSLEIQSALDIVRSEEYGRLHRAPIGVAKRLEPPASVPASYYATPQGNSYAYMYERQRNFAQHDPYRDEYGAATPPQVLSTRDTAPDAVEGRSGPAQGKKVLAPIVVAAATSPDAATRKGKSSAARDMSSTTRAGGASVKSPPKPAPATSTKTTKERPKAAAVGGAAGGDHLKDPTRKAGGKRRGSSGSDEGPKPTVEYADHVALAERRADEQRQTQHLAQFERRKEHQLERGLSSAPRPLPRQASGGRYVAVGPY